MTEEEEEEEGVHGSIYTQKNKYSTVSMTQSKKKQKCSKSSFVSI